MKTKLYHSLLLIFCLFACWLIPSNSWAKVEIDGIYYSLNGEAKTAEVTFKASMEASVYSGDLIIPESIVYDGQTYSVTSLGIYAFSAPNHYGNLYNDKLTSVTIPNSVTTIKCWALYFCTNLTSLNIPSSVNFIDFDDDGGVFRSTSSLNSITVDANNKTYDSRDNCNALIETATNTLIAGCKNTVIPNGVTSIGREAFQDCASLISIEIPNSVTCIGDDAFSGCTGLTSIIIDTDNTIYDSRNNCNAIIETATNTLLKGCNTTVIPSSVTGIALSAFSGCTGLTSVSIPNSVTSISNYAFSGCIGLASVTIPNSVTSIGWNAFNGCTGLTEVTIPNSVTEIDADAFYGCTGLTSITCESETPASVESSSFGGVDKSNCTLYVPLGSKSAYESTEGWSDFLNIVEPSVVSTGSCGDNVTYTIYSDMTMVISGTGEMWDFWDYHLGNEYYQSIEKVIIEDGVTSIGGNAFQECTNIISVTIPNGLTRIGNTAFGRCSSLASVVIPDDVVFIDGWAFWECTSLTNVTIGNGVTTIGIGAFCGCGLISLIIPNSVTDIGMDAFARCKELISVVINGDAYVDSETFGGCRNITSVTIGSGAVSILGGAFSDCSSLTSICVDPDNRTYDSRDNCNAIIETSTNNLIVGCSSTIIPNSVTSIGDCAFSGREGLTSVTIPNSVTCIGGGAFSNTPWYDNQPDGLVYAGNVAYEYKGEMPEGTSISIRNGTVSISNGAFYGCTGLNSITIPSSVTSIGGWTFSGCTGLTSVTIPSSVTCIGSYAFDGTAWYNNQPNGLIYINNVAYFYKGDMPEGTSISIRNGTVSISGYAFSERSSLTSVTIPNSVTSIGEGAFYSCTGLTSIICEGETPVTLPYSNVFYNVDKSTCTIYVPLGSKSAYENALYWNEFENIVEIDSDINAMDNAIYVEQTEGRIGGMKDISVMMKSDYDVSAFQFKMVLPEGATIKSWTISNKRLPSGAFPSTEGSISEDGTTVNIACSLSRDYYSGRDGEIATVRVEFGEEMEEGTYPIYLINCHSNDYSTIDHRLSDVKASLVLEDYLVGDANGDGQILIGDVTALLNHIVGRPMVNFNEKAADVNGDGAILVGDVTALLNIIVNQ